MSRWLDQVHSGDSFELMQKLPVGSVDTIIARPPARKDQPYNEYVEWQRDCLRAMMRVIRDDGAIFYAYNWQIQNGLVKDPTDILARFPVRNIIVWRYKARARVPGPNHTTVYLIARSDFEPVSESWDDIWTDLDSTGFAQRCIELTKGKVILDPFMDSDTVRIAAENAGRHWIGFSA